MRRTDTISARKLPKNPCTACLDEVKCILKWNTSKNWWKNHRQHSQRIPFIAVTWAAWAAMKRIYSFYIQQFVMPNEKLAGDAHNMHTVIIRCVRIASTATKLKQQLTRKNSYFCWFFCIQFCARRIAGVANEHDDDMAPKLGQLFWSNWELAIDWRHLVSATKNWSRRYAHRTFPLSIQLCGEWIASGAQNYPFNLINELRLNAFENGYIWHRIRSIVNITQFN